MSGFLYKWKFGWGNLFGSFFSSFVDLFFLCILCRVLERSTQIKDPQQKFRNSDLESETLLEAVGESWEIQTKRFEQVFGTPNDWNFSVFSMELILLWSRGSILGTPNRFYHFFQELDPLTTSWSCFLFVHRASKVSMDFHMLRFPFLAEA